MEWRKKRRMEVRREKEGGRRKGKGRIPCLHIDRGRGNSIQSYGHTVDFMTYCTDSPETTCTCTCMTVDA